MTRDEQRTRPARTLGQALMDYDYIPKPLQGAGFTNRRSVMTEKDKAKELHADFAKAEKAHVKEHAEAVKKAKAPKPAHDEIVEALRREEAAGKVPRTRE